MKCTEKMKEKLKLTVVGACLSKGKLVKYSQCLSSNVNKHCLLHSLAASLKEKLIQTFAQKQNNFLFWPKFNLCLLCARCFDIFIEIRVTIIYFLILL